MIFELEGMKVFFPYEFIYPGAPALVKQQRAPVTSPSRSLSSALLRR